SKRARLTSLPELERAAKKPTAYPLACSGVNAKAPALLSPPAPTFTSALLDSGLLDTTTIADDGAAAGAAAAGVTAGDDDGAAAAGLAAADDGVSLEGVLALGAAAAAVPSGLVDACF